MPGHPGKDAEGHDDPSVLDFHVGPRGLSEFDEELDLVEPLFPANPPPAAEFPAAGRPFNGPANVDQIARESVAQIAFVWHRPEPVPRRSWPVWLLVAAVAVSGGAWIAVYQSQSRLGSATTAPVVIQNEPHVRAIASAAMLAVPLALQPHPPLLDQVTPAESTSAQPTAPALTRPEPIQAGAGVPGGGTARPVGQAQPVARTDAPARAAVNEVLEAYRRSYNALDAAAVSAVWPGADRQALEQAFAALRHQNLSFERCDVRLTGTDHAIASCEASISAVPKSGDGEVQRRRAPWTIALGRTADRWLIAGVVNR